MKKIKVKKCLRCPYFSDCFDFSCKFNGRKIEDPYKNDIPDWCPLEDYKEKDK